MSGSIVDRVMRMHTAAVVCADKGIRITYGDLARYIGRAGEQGALDSDLHLWAKWLRSKSLPLLYVIVVSKETGTPSRGCDVASAEVPGEQARCYRHDWSAAPWPTAAELEASRA